MTADLRQAERAMLDGADQLTAAIADVQAQLPSVPKTQTAKVQTQKANYSYTYANLAKITPLVLPLLGRNGLAWITRPTMSDARGFVLEYELRHVGGASLVGTYPLPDPIRATPQEVGSAITYARRYCLCSVVGIAPDDDDDDAAAAAKTTPKAATPATRPTRATQPPRGDQAPTDDTEPAAKPAKAPRTPEQIAGARVMSMTPPDLRSDIAGLDKDDKEARKTARHDLYALAGKAWGLTAQGLTGDALALYGQLARKVAKGEATIVRDDGPPPSLKLIDRNGEAIAAVTSDLPSDQPTEETPPT